MGVTVLGGMFGVTAFGAGTDKKSNLCYSASQFLGPSFLRGTKFDGSCEDSLSFSKVR